MENQHRQIKGYRELSQEEIDLMNEIKSKGAELGQLVEKLEARHREEERKLVAPQQHLAKWRPGPKTLAELGKLYDARRWAEIGKTHIQQGLMAVTRAVARPDFF